MHQHCRMYKPMQFVNIFCRKAFSTRKVGSLYAKSATICLYRPSWECSLAKNIDCKCTKVCTFSRFNHVIYYVYIIIPIWVIVFVSKLNEHKFYAVCGKAQVFI